jgi:predicted transposase/invertase (TIGR01784 family)
MHKHIYDTNLLERLEEIVPLLNELEHRDASWYIISTLEYAIHAGHLDSEEQLDNFVSQYLSAPLRSRTMTLAKKLLLRGEALGIEKGLEKGLEKGVAKEKAAIAIKLLSENFTLDLISRVTDLSISELQQLAKTTTQV